MEPDRKETLLEDNSSQNQGQDGQDPASSAVPPRSLKTTSPAKVAANRRNAQKSTGPKTTAGKLRSRWNAVQHGLLSKSLVPAGAPGEAAFVRLLESLTEDLCPQTSLEEILVEKIAGAYWRLRIAFAYEVRSCASSRAFVETIDRTGRYTTSIHRQMMQDIAQLERLQRQRSGENIPAPISVDVQVSGLSNDAHVDALQDVEEVFATTITPANENVPEPLPPFEAAADTEETQERNGFASQPDRISVAQADLQGPSLNS